MVGPDAESDPELPPIEADVEEAMPVLPKERYDLRILSSLRRIVRSIDSYSRRLASECGMTVPQLLCMIKIDELGPLTLKELSQEVFLNPSTIVGIVDRLEKSGILMRERSVLDRRRVRISLTERGKEMVARSPSPLQESLVKAIEQLPELERATIALSLERIIQCIEDPSNGSAANAEIAAPVLEAAPDLKSTGGVSPKFRD